MPPPPEMKHSCLNGLTIFQDWDWFSGLWHSLPTQFLGMKLLREVPYGRVIRFRTCYPQIWHLGMLTVLRWRNSRNDRYRTLWLLPEACHEISCKRCSACTRRKRKIWADWTYQVSPFTALSLYPFLSCDTFSSLSTLHQTSCKKLRLNHCFGLYFFMKVPMSHKI